MDKLDIIFDMQKKLNDQIARNYNLDEKGWSDEEWIQKHLIALISELGEVLDEINYKWWKKPKEIDQNALKEELVDCLHFYISMCLKAGLSADELLQIYLEKNKENIARQEGTSLLKNYKP